MSLVQTLKSSAMKQSQNAHVYTETTTLNVSVLTDESCTFLVQSTKVGDKKHQ